MKDEALHNSTLQELSPQESAPQESTPQEIEVTLLLANGQQYALTLATDNPLLQQLFEVMMDWEGKRVRRLFQIPLKQGQAMLTFPCDRLIGVISEPPLLIQQAPVEARTATSSTPASSTTASSTTASSGTSSRTGGDRNPLVSEYLQLDNFLTTVEHQQLLEYVLKHQSDFVSTKTSTGADNYRESVVLYNFPEFSSLLEQRIREAFPDVLSKLGLPFFTIGDIEAQLTAHNDGNFYKVHNDSGSPDTATRELTYVYYFYREPKAFSGGEPIIYDSKIKNNYYVQADTFKTVEPRNNSIVFFLSRYMHEVSPIRCPSRRFTDSRFTINGWIRRI